MSPQRWWLCLAALTMAATSLAARFEVRESRFWLDGKPFQIRAGEMHFARIPKAYWRDRIRKAKAMGLNTIGTYIFWNYHEPRPGQFEFQGEKDVAEFVRTCAREGMKVLLRPGPYACAEWEWGGYPFWLANIPGMKVRTNNEPFLKAASNYFRALGRELAPLQIEHGGPILMVQVENEYGSFGQDKAYLKRIRDMIRDAGFDGLLYTADGGLDYMLKGGTIPDAIPAVNFGGGAAQEFENLRKFRPGTPLFCGEFYPGWFDHWGEPHAQTKIEDALVDIEWMMKNEASFSIYVVHGGTNFAMMNGANFGKSYQPTTTSYDYSTCLDESGRPTDKYWAIRTVMERHLGKLPATPKDEPAVTFSPAQLSPVGSLLADLPIPMESGMPLSMEQLGQDYGFVLYRTTFDRDRAGTLKLRPLRDRAILFVDGVRIGTLDRRTEPTDFKIDVKAGQSLDLLVENMGRINYGPKISDDAKGLPGKVFLDDEVLTDWRAYPLPCAAPPKKPSGTGIPGWFRGELQVTKPGDTFLDMRGWSKGLVWVNGHALGRYWRIGPQQTLYCPAVWLKAGANRIDVLELDEVEKPQIAGLGTPIFELGSTP